MEVGDQVYTLVFDFNAICEIEERFDAPIVEVAAKLDDQIRAKDLRALIAVTLQDRHPGISEKEVGRLIGEYGAEAAGQKLIEAMQSAFPQAEAAEGDKDPRKPRQRARTSKGS